MGRRPADSVTLSKVSVPPVLHPSPGRGQCSLAWPQRGVRSFSTPAPGHHSQSAGVGVETKRYAIPGLENHRESQKWLDLVLKLWQVVCSKVTFLLAVSGNEIYALFPFIICIFFETNSYQ